jgi:two-component system nitrogen regulation sensor histidine kinase GlnL
MKHDLQGIFDALLEGVVVLDDRGRVEFLNAEACRILGTSAEQAPGVPLEKLLGSEHAVHRIADQVRSSGRAAIYDEVELERRLAVPLPVDIAASPIGENARQIGGIAIAIRDRTAARSLREEISERERQESYGHIAAGIAHEVKNPLGGIRGAAELLALDATSGRSKKAAELIVQEVDRISGLVDELMVFARGDELQLETVNIHRILDSTLDLLSLERGYEQIEIHRHYDPSLPELQAEPDRLQQIFLNLARNALQAMEDEGGRLTLYTRMSLEHRLVGQDGRPKATIEVTFEDSGPGIPREILDRLSTPFFTTKQKGTGLGLSVARHWIRRHGGRLRVDSTPGHGTRVSADLPVEPLARGGTEEPPGAGGASGEIWKSGPRDRKRGVEERR